MSDDASGNVRRPIPRPSSQQTITGRPVQDEPSPKREPPEIDPVTGREVYHAYKSSIRKADRLEIRRVLSDWRAPGYRFMPDISFNGHFGTEMVLFYTSYTVHIKGKNLDPVIYAIEDSRCEFIQDYRADEFAPVADPKQPFIEEIRIEVEQIYACPGCKLIVRARPKAHLLCVDCNSVLVAR